MEAAPRQTQQIDAKPLQMETHSYSQVKYTFKVLLILLTVDQISCASFDSLLSKFFYYFFFFFFFFFIVFFFFLLLLFFVIVLVVVVLLLSFPFFSFLPHFFMDNSNVHNKHKKSGPQTPALLSENAIGGSDSTGILLLKPEARKIH